MICPRARRRARRRRRRRRGPAAARRARRARSRAGRSSSRSPTSRTCSARSTRSRRSSRRAHAAGALVARRRLAGRAADPGRRRARSTPTSTPGPATRPTGRPASACCTAARELLEAMPPFIGGGHMISSVSFDEIRCAEVPAKFEAGTSPIAEAVGLGAAVDWLAGSGWTRSASTSASSTAYALERLADVAGLTLYGPPTPTRAARVVSFALDDAHPHDVAEILGRQGVCVRAGHHCAQPLMKRLGVGATTRASFAVHNTREDVDRLVDGPRRGRADLRRLRAPWTTCTASRSSSTTSARATGAPLRARVRPRVRGQQPAVRRRAEGHARVDDDGTVDDLRFDGHGCAISPGLGVDGRPTRSRA